MKYVPIYCDQQRRLDMRLLGQRGGRMPITPLTGRSYAKLIEGEWRCSCCGESVKVVA